MAHYLIDYENIHNIRGCKKLGENDTIVFFYSATANVISIDLHLELVKTQAKTEFLLVKKASANSKNTTKNALDFQLSSYVGFLLAKFPKEKIYIVSKDKGYENLLSFWADRGYHQIELTENIRINNKSVTESDNSNESLESEVITKEAELIIEADSAEIVEEVAVSEEAAAESVEEIVDEETPLESVEEAVNEEGAEETSEAPVSKDVTEEVAKEEPVKESAKEKPVNKKATKKSSKKEPVKKDSTANPESTPQNEKERILEILHSQANSLDITEEQIKETTEIVMKYKARKTININLTSYLRDSQKVGKIFKALKSILKNKS